MTEAFTENDGGKAVVTADGDRIGTIGEVEDGRATVESNEDGGENLTDHIKEMLDWDESGNPQELESP